jgi:hypothetical protein
LIPVRISKAAPPAAAHGTAICSPSGGSVVEVG